MPDQPIPIHSAAEAQAQWQQVRRLSRWATNRGLRRIVIALWLGVLILDVQLSLFAEHHDPHAAIPLALFLFLLTAWAMRRMGRGLAQPTLEDRAQLTYGEDFDRLREPQRSEVFDQHVRDHILARSTEDLRDLDLNTRAQATAWRTLSPIFPGAAIFLFILSFDFTTHRHLLRAQAIACLAIYVLYLALPIILRLWLEPDPFTDSQLTLVSNDKQP